MKKEIKKETGLYAEGYTQNRELSWLRFDDRVLNEAKDKSVPLLERLKFVAIYSSNLSEFFRVRVGSLYDMRKVKYNAIDAKSGMNAKEQLDAIYPVAKRGCKKRDKIYADVCRDMAKEGIYDLQIKDCTTAEMKFLKKYYATKIEPLTTAMIVDTGHPFPNLISDVTYIAFVLKTKKKEAFAFVQVPTSLNGIIVLPDEHNLRFVHTEDVIRYFAPMIFPNATILESVKIRIARSAYVDPEDEAFDDIVDYRKKMIKVLKERRKMNATRIRCSAKLSAKLGKYLKENLHVSQQMFFVCNSPFSLKYAFSLGKFLNEEQKQKYLYPSYEPKLTPELNYKEDIFEQIQKKDVLLSYPYDSMNPFLQLLKEAACDQDTIAIRITIYRLADHARLVEYLCQAAENGIQVDVLIELKARFDEQNNIDYSEKLEEAGCNVFYGFEHYKVHSKICLVSKMKDGKLCHAAMLATGNFNENTAKQYTDLALLTSRASILKDCVDFFRNMSIGNLEGKYKTLLVAPVSLKQPILNLIHRETEKKDKGYIFIKINGLTDEDIIKALSEASKAGVKVDMVIRGISCLLPGVLGKTENITVRSIVGRYLEHSRIYVFGKGRDEKMYISSADFMTRNTERRVEIAIPILDKKVQKRIHEDIDLYLRDTAKARILGNNGRYHQVPCEDEVKISAQEEMMKNAKGTSPIHRRSVVKTQDQAVFDTKVKKKGKKKK